MRSGPCRQSPFLVSLQRGKQCDARRAARFSRHRSALGGGDLEFQQLERESRLDEEKENLTQQLLREVAEYQRNIVTRKVLLPGVVQCKKSKYIYPLP